MSTAMQRYRAKVKARRRCFQCSGEEESECQHGLAANELPGVGESGEFVGKVPYNQGSACNSVGTFSEGNIIMDSSDHSVLGAVGLAHALNHNDHSHGNHGDHHDGYYHNHGSFAEAVDRGEQTRDITFGQRFEAEHLRDAVFENGIAIEKIGQAAELATEKTAAAVNLAVEKTGAATLLAIEKTAAASQLVAFQNTADIRRDIADCCCELKELIREEGTRTRELFNSQELSRVRDALADAKNEALALRLESRRPV